MTTKTEWNVEGNGRRFVVYREEDGLRKWTIAEWLKKEKREPAKRLWTEPRK
jgi:hypothetical protein